MAEIKVIPGRPGDLCFLFVLSAVLCVGKCPYRIVKLLELAVLQSDDDSGLLVAADFEDVLGSFDLRSEILDHLVTSLSLNGPAFSFNPDKFVYVFNFFLFLFCHCGKTSFVSVFG